MSSHLGLQTGSSKTERSNVHLLLRQICLIPYIHIFTHCCVVCVGWSRATLDVWSDTSWMHRFDMQMSSLDVLRKPEYIDLLRKQHLCVHMSWLCLNLMSNMQASFSVGTCMIPPLLLISSSTPSHLILHLCPASPDIVQHFVLISEAFAYNDVLRIM